MFAGKSAALNDDYWKHVGVFEDAVKLGAEAGLISEGEAKRAIRMVVSQPDALFYGDVMASPDVIRNPSEMKGWFTSLMSKGEAAQQGANFGPRIEGHHPVSVSSTHAAGQHLPITQHGQFIEDMYYRDGIPVGTVPSHMVGLSKPAHTGNAPMNAHWNPITGMTDEGYWQGAFDGKSYGDDIAALTAAFENQSAMPQIRLAEVAGMQPGETEIINAMAEEVGVSPRELLSTSVNQKGFTDANTYKKRMAGDKFDTVGLTKLVYGNNKTARGGAKTSNKTMLSEDRAGAPEVRRDLGLGGNERIAQDINGNLVMQLRSNNPRRRL